MSRKEPLLGALKACILSLQADKDPITDRNVHLTSLCDILEIILRKGIRQPVIGLRRRDYWHWLEQLPQLDPCSGLIQISTALEKTIACKKLLTAQGRGRHFIRLALNQKILAVIIQHLRHTPRLIEWYDPESSILAIECFAEPFLSLLLVLSQMNFTLDLQAQTVLQKLRGKPLSFEMIRWKWHDGTVYGPMLPHLQLMQKEIPNFQLQCDNKSNKVMKEDGLREDRLLYSLRFLGKVNIGMYGGKEVLDVGIERVLQQNLPPQEVLFDVKETEVICLKYNSTQVLFHHHFPEISSVGHRLNRRTLFAYCVANSPETPQTTSFDCLVYESNFVEEANEIILRIAAGFRHTEWFV
ncbi:uncharacterized protein si:ch211-250n8.1 isoform X3 [Hemiscyllium ocellatum]|uniref:uncharacterized protein si:ch211-250n8.1 isoform X3 n=1 Tax=Hemiscyllium ocellatum TaxID=170820 RepID=UPI00296600E0|nr:uncharacterized protein si:ch211-250n8.1 isoform X3 [Hemiscyllium ocellatum]